MTDVYGPFDAAPGDPRLWTQDAWYRHAPKWAPSGVNGSPAASTTTGDLPITFSGLNFTVGVGRGWVRGAGFERSGTPTSQAIAPNTNVSLSRRDRVVLRRDLAAKTVAPTLIQGTPSSSPTAPAIQQVETGQFDEPLYSFLVPPNSGTGITGTVDERLFVDPGSGAPYAKNKALLDAMATTTRPVSDGTRVYTTDDGRYWRWDAASSSWLYGGGNPPPIVTCSAGSGWSQAPSRSPGVFRDSSGMICLVGSITPISSYNPEDAGTHTALQIPTGYRPAVDAWVTLPVSFPGIIVIGFIKAADGILYITSATQSITVGAGQLHVLDGIRYHPTYAGSALP